TPPAATTTGPRTGGHVRKLRQQPAPRAPRRVSGPLRGRIAAPRDQSRTAAPRPKTRTTAPRPQTRTATRRAPSLGARAVAFVRALPDHGLIDRLVRGRAWIPVLGVMLAGIVAMQVAVLKLGAGVGR